MFNLLGKEAYKDVEVNAISSLDLNLLHLAVAICSNSTD